MTSVLKMIYKEPTTAKTLSWTLADPVSGLTKVQVATVMNDAITKEAVIISGETETIELSDAYIYNTDKIELA